MTADDARPFSRHWVEVYMGNDSQPAYRGVFLPGDGVTFAVFGGGSSSDSIRTPRERPLVADIARIVRLDDPDWLVESNLSATLLSAENLLE